MASISISGIINDANEKSSKAQGESLSAFLASLTTSATACGLIVTIVFFLRWKCPKIYHLRRHLEAVTVWQPPPFRLKMILFPMEDISIDKISGLENYLFERYLHTILRIFIPLALILLPILIPLNAADGKNEQGGVRGLDRLSFSNVGLSHTDRYWAHLSLALFVAIYVCLILRFELQYYSRLQQKMDKTQWGSSTVLLSSSSKELLDVGTIQKHLDTFHGGIRTVRINQDHRGLLAKIHKRNKLIAKLEAAETNLIRKAIGKRDIQFQKTTEYNRSKPLWESYLKYRDRPSMYVSEFGPNLPLISDKVDAIDYCRAQIVRYNHEIKFDRHHLSKLPLSNSAFVQFNNRLSTPLAALLLRLHIPPSWTIKHYASYSDVIWSNVTLSWWELFLRQVVVYLFVTLLVLGFVFPVSIAGSLSQVAYLAGSVPGLLWLGTLPDWLLATVQGTLPTVMIALITAMVPLILRLLANLQGQHSRQAVEKSVQLYYFAFLFVQIFLVVSLSAGIATVIEQLPSTIESVPAVLAKSLPKAGNYFFSYITIYTMGTVTASLLQINTLLQLGILSPVLDHTPRQKWEREKVLALKKWGTFVPVFANLACIGLIFSVVCPLILLFSNFCFGALWILYRYNPPKLSEFTFPTGAFYPTAIRQLFVGLYFSDLCLIGLFFLVRDSDDKATCIGQGVIMIFITVCTMIFQYSIDQQHGRLLPARLTNSTLNRFVSNIGHLWSAHETSEQESSASRNGQQIPDSISQNQPLRDQAIIWIPRDYLGIGASEIYYLKKYSNCLDVSIDGAYLNRHGKIVLHGLPPI